LPAWGQPRRLSQLIQFSFLSEQPWGDDEGPFGLALLALPAGTRSSSGDVLSPAGSTPMGKTPPQRNRRDRAPESRPATSPSAFAM